MNEQVIKKLFGSLESPSYYYADWRLGPSRIAGLTEYALNALEAEANRVYQKEFKGTPKEQWFLGRVENLKNVIRATVPTWRDESLGPTDESGTPLFKIGRGAKHAYLNYIDGWVKRMIAGLVSEAKAAAKKSAPAPAAPRPDFEAKAKQLADQYPDVLSILRDTFVQQAVQFVTEYGWTEAQALNNLKQQLESIRQANPKVQGGIK